MFPQPGDTYDHRFLSESGDVERNTLAMFPNSDEEIHRVGDLSMSILRSISVQHSDGEIDGNLLEVVFFNKRGVDVVGFVRRLEARKLNLTLRGIKE